MPSPDANTVVAATISLGGLLAVELIKRAFSKPKEDSDLAASIRTELRADNLRLKTELEAAQKLLVEERKARREEEERLRGALSAAVDGVHAQVERATAELRSECIVKLAEMEGTLSEMTERYRAALGALDGANAELRGTATELRAARARCYDLERQLKKRPPQ